MDKIFNRNFGIELEFSQNTNREFLYWNLSRICPNDTILITEWQKNIDNKEWICKTDSSCGYEIASPVFKGIQDLIKLKNVINFLKQNGAQTSRKCAIHVHVECKDFNAYNLARIMAYWIKYEGIIFNMFPKYRRECLYCMPLNNNLRNSCLKSKKHTPRQLISLNSQKRNHSLNMKDYKKRGTIEFRLLEGVLNSFSSYLLFHSNALLKTLFQILGPTLKVSRLDS
jgi:hypothetical protein